MSVNFRPETMANLKQIGLSDAQISALSQIKPVTSPNTASISQMFSKSLVAELPADAQLLTKADLMSLGGWGSIKLTPAAAKLSSVDISSIRTILGSGIAERSIGMLAMNIACCCCPCCCAVAVTAKKSITKARAFVC